MPDEESTSRTAVKTYVPAYQKDTWETHADELQMSQSEYVRMMVQAGRRHFEDEGAPSQENTAAEPSNSSDGDLTQVVRSHLTEHDSLTWEELVAAITDDVEARLENSLDDLQEANVVKYSGRKGGYTLVEP